MNNRIYPCEFCDTEQEQVEQRVTLTMQRNGRWYIFENVPAKVCPNCGHRYYDGPTLLRLEQMIRDNSDDLRPVEAWAFSLPT
ncbi:MAG: type II toxin-antitoxin system MqsA family antitoxin [Chloroflexi bacterium]|nr:type II toxin-antitoxin system MqsA family antitoxin [Chloroflexota bacterium]